MTVLDFNAFAGQQISQYSGRTKGLRMFHQRCMDKSIEVCATEPESLYVIVDYDPYKSL